MTTIQRWNRTSSQNIMYIEYTSDNW